MGVILHAIYLYIFIWTIWARGMPVAELLTHATIVPSIHLTLTAIHVVFALTWKTKGENEDF